MINIEFQLGPYKLNGVPLRRVNQRYVIATSTKVPLTGVNVKDIDDKFFAREKEVKKGTEDAMFEGEAKATVISPARKAAQTTVDAALVKNIEKLDTLSAYISAKFSLSKADKPHTMIF
jgi:large subunit ribosomal protein L6e